MKKKLHTANSKIFAKRRIKIGGEQQIKTEGADWHLFIRRQENIQSSHITRQFNFPKGINRAKRSGQIERFPWPQSETAGYFVERG